MMGALEDGKRAIARYIYNNFHDTYNQNSSDLLLQKIKCTELENNDSREGKGLAQLAILVALIVII